jgi:SEC-C motif-containing protein
MQHYHNSNNNNFKRSSKMNNSKIGRNELCPCGSGKKYKKCCWGKESTPLDIFDPKDSDTISICTLLNLNVIHEADVTLLDGKVIKGKSKKIIVAPYEVNFPFPKNKQDLYSWLTDWSKYSSDYFNDDHVHHIYNNFILTNPQSLIKMSQQPESNNVDSIILDSNNKVISNYSSVKCNEKFELNCSPNSPHDIAFINSRQNDRMFLSSYFNLSPGCFFTFDNNLVIQAIDYLLKGDLNEITSCKGENNLNPDELMIFTLSEIIQEYYTMKFKKVVSKDEGEKFAELILKENQNPDMLLRKTNEVHLALLIDIENVLERKRDNLIDEWLKLLFIPKDYGEEENKIRMEAARNAFWQGFEPEEQKFDLKKIESEFDSHVKTNYKRLKGTGIEQKYKKPATSYFIFKDGAFIVSEHKSFSKIERDILREIFRNPEHFAVYFRNMILSDTKMFNITPAYFIDDTFWSSSVGIPEKLLIKPITFDLSITRKGLFSMFDEKILQNIIIDDGLKGFLDYTGLTCTPYGIFSRSPIPNPKFEDTCNQILKYIADYEKNNGIDLSPIYQYNMFFPVLFQNERTFRFVFGEKFISQHSDLIKIHLQIMDEFKNEKINKSEEEELELA